ncbi:MAG: IS256 family transposase [Candidatus Binatia bacterium]
MKSPQATPETRVRETEKNVQEEMWKFIAATLKQGLRHLLENLLEDEVTASVKARKYERSAQRQGYRGGHYLRDLVTRYGLLEGLRVPRIAEGPMDFQLFDKYERRRSDVDAAIGRLFLQGISTRKLRGIARDLFGREVSATTVSKTASYLDEELKHYQTRLLNDDFPFLFLDGITQKVREIGVEKKVMLCALGLKEDGTKEMLSFRLVDKEEADSWRAFLVDLKSRGLLGKALRLITTDGNPALLKALKEIYPFLKVQRCIVHKLRNVATKLKRVHLKPCMAEAKAIFAAPSRREAIKRFKAWKDKWQVEEERAVRCMEKDLYHCLHYYSFPRELWKKIRTTNLLERDFREVRRRTRPMGFFPTDDSAQRIFYGVTNGIHQNRHHPLPTISAEILT